MREDFCAFILTHGRPDRLYTLDVLKKTGYTGKIYVVIDNEDKKADEYKSIYGDKVLQFDKAKIAKTFDEGDNFNDRRAIIYARNICFELAKKVGCRYFVQLDDDYTALTHTISPENEYLTSRPTIKNANAVFDALVRFLENAPHVATIAVAQGGDFIGGPNSNIAKKSLARKAMNSFVCDIEKPFQFHGRINEDVNTYTYQARNGLVMLTYPRVRLEQKRTQSNAGGMTELYLDSGTYVKSFYSVMYAPSCVKVKMMQSAHSRLHHSVNWTATTPKIIREAHRKPR